MPFPRPRTPQRIAALSPGVQQALQGGPAKRRTRLLTLKCRLRQPGRRVHRAEARAAAATDAR
eukprot:8949887-Alexandrium_andersonii.AAC.1